jgi:hypothetical protein
MHSKSGHLIGLLAGLIAAPVLFFLMLKAGDDLTRIALFDGPNPPGGPSMSTAGSASAALLLAVAAVIAGLLAGTWRLPPLAPLAAGLPLVALGVYGEFDFVGMLRLLNHLLPSSLMPTAVDLEFSRMPQVLGVVLLVSAGWPWRWTGRPVASPRPHRGAVGIIAGTAAFPALWYLIQLANPVGYSTLVFDAHLPRVSYLFWLPQLAAGALMATLAAARWASPDAAGIAGLPLLVIGLLLALVPVDAARWIAPFVWSSRQISFGIGQSLSMGAFLLFGGLLATSALLPGRWRQPSSSPAADDAPVSEPV